MSKADDRRREYARDLTPGNVRPNEPPTPIVDRCHARLGGDHDVSRINTNGEVRCWYCAQTRAQIEAARTRPPMPPITPELRTPMPNNEVLLIDLSSIAYPIWHMSEAEPDTNHTSHQVVTKIRFLAREYPHAAICCDKGRSFRKDVAPTYKAQRPQHEAALYHQIDRAKALLVGDGFPVWSVDGFEADDLIATACMQALAADLTVAIVSSDKDLLPLVRDRVRVILPKDQSVLDVAAVVEKYGVRPDQIRDYLTIAGDASDNIKGVAGIGAKGAAAILGKFGTLDAAYVALAKNPATFKPAAAKALEEFKATLETTRTLLDLRIDVPIPFAEISLERVPTTVAAFAEMAEGLEEPDDISETMQELPPASRTPGAVSSGAPRPGFQSPAPSGGDSAHSLPRPTAERVAPPDRAPRVDAAEATVGGTPSDLPGTTTPAPGAVAASRPIDPPAALVVQASAPVVVLPYERALDPRDMKDAITLSNHMFNSNMFSAYGTPQAVLSTIMVGRELGIPAMASLRGIHNIEGRHALSAHLMVAIVLKSGFAEYFEPISFDETHATFETKRRGGRQPIRLTHTIEMAKTAGLLKPDSNWVKVPTDMCVARCQARLARMIYPDLLGGLYTPEELREIAADRKAA